MSSTQPDKDKLIEEIIPKVITDLRTYAEDNGFKGYDPYDLLSSSWHLERLGPTLSFILTQLTKRSPLNLRPLLSIQKDYVPKGLALFLKAYCNLYHLQPSPDIKAIMDQLVETLLKQRSPGYDVWCWGLNYSYASRIEFLPAQSPSVVVTSYVNEALWEYYKIFPSNELKEIILSCGDYVMDILPRAEEDFGICFSYNDKNKDLCFNANGHGAEILSRNYSIAPNEEWKKLARASNDFNVHYQNEDGSWNYRIYKSGKHKKQIDFHQGYVVNSILEYCELTGDKDEKLIESAKKGAGFYRKYQFDEQGRAYWRYPTKWPVDIHNQTQGIISFAKLSQWFDKEYLTFAYQIADWTMNNMRHPKGYFYYKKYGPFSNKIPYMRWGQAWMLVALTTLLKADKASAIGK